MTLPPTATASSIEPVSILLVDDHVPTLETLADLFTDLGFHTETATTGAQALARLRERFFNLALLDIRLPDIQGTELLVQARLLRPDMKFIMATGNASLPSVKASLNEGAYAYLEKPVKATEVETLTQRALEQQRLEQENQALRDLTDAALATLELEPLLNRVLQQFVSYHRADRGVLYLKEPNDPVLVPRAVSYADRTIAESLPEEEPVPEGEGLVGQAAAERRQLAAAGDELAGDRLGALGVRASIVAPLFSRNRLIGALRLDRLRPGAFSAQDYHLLGVLAERAAVLVDNARLYDAERYIARTLAQFFLSETPRRPDVDLASRYVPASVVSQVGGDYFDFIPLDEKRIGVVIGDVCGKDLTAVRYTAMAKYMLRAYAMDSSVRPAEIITRLNHALYAGMSGDEGMFITMVYGVLDLGEQTFTYTNAGHPPPILCTPGDDTLHELSPTGMMVGALDGVEYDQEVVRLEPGSVLVMTTDGVTEARAGNQMLGTEGVEEVLREAATGTAERISDAIYRRALDFAEGLLQDDVAIVVIKMRGD